MERPRFLSVSSWTCRALPKGRRLSPGPLGRSTGTGMRSDHPGTRRRRRSGPPAPSSHAGRPPYRGRSMPSRHPQAPLQFNRPMLSRGRPTGRNRTAVPRRCQTRREVVAATVVRSSGFKRLDEAALASLRTWRCNPSQRDGRPSRAVALQPFKFTLEGI